MSECGSTLPKRQLGRYLRNGREECGLTLQQAAGLLERSTTTLQRIERGMVAHLREADIETLCKVYDFSDEHTVAMKALAVQGNGLNWWCEYGDVIPENFDFYVGLEASAGRLISYEPELVPGLLQTPAYGSALMHASHPEDSAEEHARRVQLRMRRQTRITRKYRPASLDVILRESALHGVVGGPKVMAVQLRHLADVGTRSNVNVRVLPFACGFPLGEAVGPFVILEFDSTKRAEAAEPPVVYTECFTGGLYLAKSSTVRRYHQAYQDMGRSALDPNASRARLRQMAKEYMA